MPIYVQTKTKMKKLHLFTVEIKWEEMSLFKNSFNASSFANSESLVDSVFGSPHNNAETEGLFSDVTYI